ncbi:MAG: competence/damage-inducible protein A [Acidaminococcaceae bacterium]|nr:competence/damage-inducible protein A [Acidaminococcaceae bacterium]
MRVEVINTGTELLLGDILNTNFQYISKKLNYLGFDVLYQTTVGDNPQRMKQVLQQAMERSDIIITSGGLGPTRGDITKEVVTELCGLETYMDLGIWGNISDYFYQKGMIMPQNNEKQAYIPLGAEILENSVGTAPGIWLESDGKVFILLPGPPAELEDVFSKQLMPRLMKRYGNLGSIVSRVIHLRKIGESQAAELLDTLIVEQTNPTVALYARKGEVVIRITAKASNYDEAKKMLDNFEVKIRQQLGDHIYGIDDEPLAAALGKLLSERGKRLAIAESCSGGLVSSMITDISGASEYFAGAAVTYTNEAKQKLVNVSDQTLQKHGAVSKETACEMAVGVKDLFGSDYGLSITGNAGPGASEGKQIGLVYIAMASDEEVYCEEYRFLSTRIENKQRIAVEAISMVIDKIIEETLNTEEKN